MPKPGALGAVGGLEAGDLIRARQGQGDVVQPFEQMRATMGRDLEGHGPLIARPLIARPAIARPIIPRPAIARAVPANTSCGKI